MRLSDLRDTIVRDLDGRKLGRVHEVHCEKGRITALMCGSGGLIERWTGKTDGRRIPWESVRKMGKREIVVSFDQPKRSASKPSVPRSRQGTRRPSAPRSKR
jgi:sporulation protein YlmC with PRC-barrel domain